MYLIGSRNLGIENERSDWDYIEIDGRGSTCRDIVNVHFDEHKHCYHAPKDYIEKVGRFEINDSADTLWVYNAEYYRTGLIEDNPLNYREIWVERLKNMDIEKSYFWSQRMGKFMKRFYHVVYNVECLKENTLYPDMTRVKLFHDRQATQEDYESVLEDIQNL